jgi:hypothetical protein
VNLPTTDTRLMQCVAGPRNQARLRTQTGVNTVEPFECIEHCFVRNHRLVRQLLERFSFPFHRLGRDAGIEGHGVLEGRSNVTQKKLDKVGLAELGDDRHILTLVGVVGDGCAELEFDLTGLAVNDT